MVLPKPPHGQPCNSCGRCCADELCPLAGKVFRGDFHADLDGPCPALESDGDKRVCGLIAHPMAYAMALSLQNGVENMRNAAAHLVGAGRGCDAQLEGEPADEAFRASMFRERQPRLTERSLKMWGIVR